MLENEQCCQKVLAENPHSISQKSPLVPTKVSSQKSPHFAKISPLFLKIPTIFEKNPNILLKFLQFFKKIPTFCKNFPLFSKNFKNFNPHLKKMVPTEPLKIPTVGINPHFRQHWVVRLLLVFSESHASFSARAELLLSLFLVRMLLGQVADRTEAD